MTKILIVDDDASIGNMLEEMLIKEGYRVFRAYSGTEALLLLREDKPDLALLDLMLPGLSGEEVLPYMQDIPVIVMSARADVEDKVELLLGGAADYVTKPFSGKELMARIMVQLRKKEEYERKIVETSQSRAFETEKQAKNIADRRKLRNKEKDTNRSGMTLDDLFGAIKSGIKEINVVLKTDVNGSLEAIKQSLSKINVDGVKVTVIRGGVGTITESDVVLANASRAIIIGFNVRPTSSVIDIAKEYNVDIKLYDIIYKMIEDIEAAMKGMLDPEYEEVVIGEIEVRQLFKFSKVGVIAGSYVKSGTIKNGANARVIRDGIVLATTKIKSLQREKDQVKEVPKGMECGVTLENYQDVKENDIIEVYELREIKR